MKMGGVHKAILLVRSVTDGFDAMQQVLQNMAMLLQTALTISVLDQTKRRQPAGRQMASVMQPN